MMTGAARSRPQPLRDRAPSDISTPRPRGRISTQLARKVVGAALALGAEPAGLLAAAGLTPELLADAEGTLPLEVFLTLFDEAARRSGDDAFGLHVAELSRRQPDNPLALAVHSSATLGEAYRRAARYVHLINDTLEIRLEIEAEGEGEGDRCRLSHHQHAPIGRVRHGVELSLAMFFLVGKQTAGPGFGVERVSFRHARPASDAEHVRLFEAPVDFAQPHDALHFPASHLDLPLVSASPRAVRHLDRLLDELLASRPERSGLAEQVRAALAADLRSGPSLDDVAARLGTTPRSLQRRLRAEGSSFLDLLDELRRELSQRYLAEAELSLAEVAFALGFAEQSAFQRAFRRWMGTTPAEWRRARAAGR
jgi:AraC-like DNA-binding protein